MLIMLLFEEEEASPRRYRWLRAFSDCVRGDERGGGVECVVAAMVRIEVEEEGRRLRGEERGCGREGVYFLEI